MGQTIVGQTIVEQTIVEQTIVEQTIVEQPIVEQCVLLAKPIMCLFRALRGLGLVCLGVVERCSRGGAGGYVATAVDLHRFITLLPILLDLRIGSIIG